MMTLLSPTCRNTSFGLLLLGLASCSASEPERIPFPEPPRAPIVEEELKPAGHAEVAILDLNEEQGSDKNRVAVSGKLLNRGTRATRRIIVHVQALDASGRVLEETEAFATPEAIEPGNTGRFRVEMSNRPDTQDYHVEVLYKP